MSAGSEFASSIGTFHVLLVLVALSVGRYDEALDRAPLGVDCIARYAGSYPEAAALRQAQVWQHLGQWAQVQQVLDWPEVRDSGRVSCQVHAAVLQHHVDPALGCPQGEGLVQALGEPDDVNLAATAVQHRGTALAANVRAAGPAAEVDAARAAGHAQRALDLAVRLGSTMLQPGESWLSCARAQVAHSEAAQARAVLSAGREWLQRTAQDHVPTSFRDSFLSRNPVNRELLRWTSRLLD